MGYRMGNLRLSRCQQALGLLHMFLLSHVAALNTFYTVEFPEYSLPSQEVSVVFTIEAPNSGSGPAPLSLTTVLDRSQSMQGRKLDLLKKTNQFLVETMMKNNGLHDLGVVTYSNLLNELIGLQPVTDTSGPLMNYFIGDIQAAGTTYLSGGLVKGLQQQRNRPSEKVQSVYLFTDGLPTEGPTTSWEILQEVRNIRNYSPVPISIYTFGFGEDVDTQLLWDIATEGNGVAYVISNENDIPAAFGDALGALLSSVAQDVKCVFKPTDGAIIKGVEAPGDITFLSDGSVEVTLFDLFAQESRDILLTIEVPGTSNAGYQKMVYVETSYKDAVTRQYSGGNTVDLGCQRVAQPTVVAPAERVEVVKIYYVTSQVLEDANDEVEEGDDDGAKKKLEEAEERILSSPLKDRPRLQTLLRDVRRVREAVVDRALSRTRSGGLLRNLVSAVRTRRSARTDSDQLETGNALDTDARRATREEASEGVLGDRQFNVEPAQGPRLGPIGQAIGQAIGNVFANTFSGGSQDSESSGDSGEAADDSSGGSAEEESSDDSSTDSSSEDETQQMDEQSTEASTQAEEGSADDASGGDISQAQEDESTQTGEASSGESAANDSQTEAVATESSSAEGTGSDDESSGASSAASAEADEAAITQSEEASEEGNRVVEVDIATSISQEIRVEAAPTDASTVDTTQTEMIAITQPEGGSDPGFVSQDTADATSTAEDTQSEGAPSATSGADTSQSEAVSISQPEEGSIDASVVEEASSDASSGDTNPSEGESSASSSSDSVQSEAVSIAQSEEGSNDASLAEGIPAATIDSVDTLLQEAHNDLSTIETTQTAEVAVIQSEDGSSGGSLVEEPVPNASTEATGPP